jgi:hypothetical protein
MATTKHRQLTDEQRAQHRRQKQLLTERAVAQPTLQRGVAALADRPRPRRAAPLQRPYLEDRCH